MKKILVTGWDEKTKLELDDCFSNSSNSVKDELDGLFDQIDTQCYDEVELQGSKFIREHALVILNDTNPDVSLSWSKEAENWEYLRKRVPVVVITKNPFSYVSGARFWGKYSCYPVFHFLFEKGKKGNLGIKEFKKTLELLVNKDKRERLFYRVSFDLQGFPESLEETISKLLAKPLQDGETLCLPSHSSISLRKNEVPMFRTVERSIDVISSGFKPLHFAAAYAFMMKHLHKNREENADYQSADVKIELKPKK